ncbi:hypothetical protein [Phnomibacter ginsenosidimutans]|uniref:Bulb-type lectin domain-containing protein n=1 Tax=Phnomibacter ginsenosidimutans TaxID=2676868 RepID=A0A6I6G5T6_9BACT|nr:hypothetical protein [Phnomibacter ginsenosidimutans]QGW28036.1 hypothetical protein GLV81_07940 [Phnomibacter ginsenosidimutans]
MRWTKIFVAGILCMLAITSQKLMAQAGCEAKDAAIKYQSSMNPGQKLLEKEKMVSANGRYQLRATTDGNFVIEEVVNAGDCSYKEVYRFPLQNGGSKPSVGFFSFNPDGNLCMDSKNGKGYCATTGRDAAAALILGKGVKLEMSNDGRLRLLDKQGKEIWTTPIPTTTTTPTPTTPTAAKAGCEAKDAIIKYQSSMTPGQKLLEKEKLVSANGRYQLRATTDGNFVIEEVVNAGNCSYNEIFRFPLQNGGSKPTIGFFSFNPDGNLCMDSKNGKGYCVTTGRDAAAALILGKAVKLEITNDGRLILLDKKGQEIWATRFPETTSVKPTTQPVPVESKATNEVFTKGKPVLSFGEDFGIGKTLTSDNNQYQARIVIQKIDVGSGQILEQNRFVIEKITVRTVNGQPIITEKTEIWNKQCAEAKILTNDKPNFQSRRLQDCFYEAKLPHNAVEVRMPYEMHFGQIKLENDGSDELNLQWPL